jgi:tetratricopeptide (TPR) repeat protein
MVGRTVLHYTITAELGAGAMGRVYLAQDDLAGRRVALKFLPPEAAGDAVARARLVREATAAARLSHPNIVTLYSVEEDAGEVFLVEEYVEGPTLARRLERGPLGPQETLRLAQALASALAQAHQHGVLHRDLKPANVLVAADGTFKVADFGIARVEGAATLTGEGTVAGTTAYMAPERLGGHRGDARADLFALGAVLYEALTARRAFPGETEAEVVYGVLNAEPRPPEVPTASLLPLAALVMRLLAKDPAGRPESATAVLEALRVMQPAGPAVRARRRPAWLAPAAAALALLMVLAALWWARAVLAPPAGVEPSVAVLYFENLADPQDAARVGSITGNLLITSLAQAPRLNVLSTQRVLDAMRHVSRGHAALDRSAALEVARRVHAARIVTGTILQTAPAIVMTAEVSEVRSGRVLCAERIEGQPGQTVFQVVDALGARLLARMTRAGEAPRLAPVAERTSTDLVAQRQYLEGLEALAGGRIAAADTAFSAAVARDPGFAQAWYQLAIARWWENEPDAARADILKARAWAGRLSPQERELLEGLAAVVDEQWAAAVARFERLAAAYPDDKLALYGLVEARFHGRDMAGTVTAARRVLALDPGFTLAGRHLMDALLALNRPGEAESVGRDMLRRSPGNLLVFDNLAFLAMRRLDADGLERLRSLPDAPRASLFLPALVLLAVARDSDAVAARLLSGPDEQGWRSQGWRLADARRGAAYWIALRKGRYREALRLGQEAWSPPARPPISYGLPPLADGYWAALGLCETSEAFRFADSLAHRVMRPGPRRDIFREVARAGVWLAVGRRDEARAALRRAETAAGTRSWNEAGAIHYTRARLLSAEGRHAEALEEVKGAEWLGFQMMWGGRVLERARIELKLGRPAEALAALDSLVRCPLVYPDEAARLHLHRGQALEKLNRPVEAAAAYREFLRLWRDADPGRPEVAEARAALARLGRAAQPPVRPRH